MDTTRAILVVSLCFVLLLIWQAWQRDYGTPPADVTPAGDVADMPERPADLPQLPRGEAEAVPEVGEAPPTGQQRVRVTTDVLRVEIDTLGADIRKVQLLDYPVAVKRPDEPFTLMDDSEELRFFTQSGLLSRQSAPTHHALFVPERDSYTLMPGQQYLEAVFTWEDEGVRVRKIYTFHPGRYLVNLRYQVEAPGDAGWAGRPYTQLQRAAPRTGRGLLYTYTGAAISSPEKRYEKIKFDDMAKEELSRDIAGGWAAMLQHYFVAALVPDPAESHRYYSKALADQRYAIGLLGPEQQVAAGESAVMEVDLYMGPKLQDRMAAIAPGLDLTVDYGFLWFIAKPLFWLLDKIHGLIGNWGGAIILLTLLIKLAFFKLSAASYKSMANMRRVQPRLLALKERFGNDRARMNQAMMQLYKEEKINPLGGCLPILIQIPVFIALYWVLLESVELRQAPFMLWIRDLSLPDPFFVLPLLMGVSMFLQQKLNPAPLDPIQQKVMSVLPIVFTVFFAFFPSGLVLYWLVNNILSIAQQWVITRRIEAAGRPA